MNTAMMIGKENGNGINSDIARLIPSDIAIHNNCCERKSLLLLNQSITHIFIITILNTILFDDLEYAVKNYIINWNLDLSNNNF